MVDIASRWNVEGLIILGYNDEKYRKLSRKLNKKMVLIDAYPAGEYFFQNVGVDDYSGGYQIGSYLCLTGIFTFDSIPGQLIGFRFHFGSKMFLIPSNDYPAFGCF